jgi:heme/copper-type cytochrome/quinol oxidase subunit 2
VLVLIIIAVIVVLLLVKKRRKGEDESDETEENEVEIINTIDPFHSAEHYISQEGFSDHGPQDSAKEEPEDIIDFDCVVDEG